MAKTRAQRKAERRAREAEEQRRAGGPPPEQQQPQPPPPEPQAPEQTAQHDTQVPVSGDVAEVEAVEATGAQVAEPQQAPEAPPPAPVQEPPQEAAPRKPSRRERAEERRRAKAAEKEQARREREKDKAVAEKGERQRGVVFSFIASSWAELKRVQWPDRETLIQASAVTLVFVAVAAAYLGALDAAFSFLIKRIL